ncbi:hypothetical protein Y032_1125g3641 [Ancylostoma ceylanicum]|uniref:Uncharacterized protein n=1 Tax=Ancylostoma ceylanicum TaxID=53326 RepID=A0A016W6G8_9BILA|nr:hypothetical protein Y032_1125g3641 [Ancylostoma ceylanicum]
MCASDRMRFFPSRPYHERENPELLLKSAILLYILKGSFRKDFHWHQLYIRLVVVCVHVAGRTKALTQQN